MALEDWKPRKRARIIAWGYKKGGDPDLVVPDPVFIELLEQALDQLDNGISYRDVADWLNAEAWKIDPEYKPLTHAGLRIIRTRERPNHPRKNIKSPKEPKTRTERILYKKRNSLAQEKKRLIATQKRIEKQKESLDALLGSKKETKELEALPYILVPPEETVDFQEAEQKEDIIFQPNPGPQWNFLAAGEQEVLYGGAAGGELKSKFLPPPFAVMRQNKTRELLECLRRRISSQAPLWGRFRGHPGREYH